MLNKFKRSFTSSSLLSIFVTLLLAFNVADAYLPRPEAMRLCRERTGLIDKDIKEYKLRNENCAIDCITNQGLLFTAHPDDGFSCHDGLSGYRCILGQCRSPEEKIDEDTRSDLNLVSINVKSAFVADRDPYPTQGESDAFVVVEVVSNGAPSYKDGEVVCHTHVVQDNSRPRWNFVCKPLPMKSNTKLRFVVMDSDKPDPAPQLLGAAVHTLETLLNSGSQTLTLEQPKLSGGPYWLEVDITGKKYTPSD